MNKQAAEHRLADFLMDDIPVMEIAANRTAMAADWFAVYKKLRREFMRSLSDSITELSFLNLSQDEFMGLILGRSLPQNLTMRLRVPLQFGGKLEIDNMFMCRTFSTSHNLDRFIIEQSGNKMLWLPNPEKKVYVSANTAGGGDGGNATSDRLTQMAAQFAKNLGME
jgi:hypothetical protein